MFDNYSCMGSLAPSYMDNAGGKQKSIFFKLFDFFTIFSIALTALYKIKIYFCTMLLYGFVNTCIVFFKFDYSLYFYLISSFLSLFGIFIILKEDSYVKKSKY